MTGDGSLVSVNMLIRYRIKSPKDWYLTARSPGAILEAEAYRLIGEDILTRSIFWVIGPSRQQLAETISQQIQQISDDQRLGLEVLQVNLLNAHPPTSLNDNENVAKAYLQVFDKVQERQQNLNAKRLEAIREVDSKATEAAKIINEAQAQYWQIINTAAGRTDRFGSILRVVGQRPEYLPLVQRKLYLQYLLEALGEKTGKIVIDPRAFDGEVEIWLQYPPKPSPFGEETPALLPPPLGSPTSQGK